MGIIELLEELKLIEKTFRVKIITSNYKQISDSEISWDNYKSGIFKNIYAKEYESIIRNRQYSFLLSDEKGCIQFYYLIKNEEIEKVKMAYYPYPVELNNTKDDFENLIDDSNDEVLTEYYYDLWNIFTHNFELTVNDENLKKLVEDSLSYGNNESAENLLLSKLDYKYKTTNTSHIRVDYDNNVKSHHKCEIQIGAINNIRFPLKKLISPFLFFEFIFKNVYKEEFNNVSSKANYQTIFAVSKKKSKEINLFIEKNLYFNHD